MKKIIVILIFATLLSANDFFLRYTGFNGEDNITLTNSNLGIGDGTLDSLTSGVDNYCIGYLAGRSIEAHSRNIFIGTLAGWRMYTGVNDNIFIGDRAGTYGGEGSYNIGIGTNALGGQIGTRVSSGYNIAIGYNALQKVTSGRNNIGIGYQAGIVAGSGRDNTYIGFATASLNTNGGYNLWMTNNVGKAGFQADYGVLLGYGAGRYHYGDYNTITGSSAMLGSSGVDGTSTHSSVYGYSAGKNLTTGSYNTLIGDSAGVNLTTGKHNTFIGSNAGSGYTTQDSTTVIGIGNDPLIVGNNTKGVVNRGVTIDGYIYKTHEPFAKFKRTTTFTPTAADTWLRVPICESSGLHNTSHFTCAADSSLLIGRAMMLQVSAAVKEYIGVNTSETVLFRLVKGVLGGSRVYSVCGQHEETDTKSIGDNRTIGIPTSHMGFYAGDSLWLEMKTTDVGIILQPNTNFNNPASGTINLEYLFDL